MNAAVSRATTMLKPSTGTVLIRQILIGVCKSVTMQQGN